MTEQNNEWGQTFKYFRESRGFSLKEAAGDLCTPQYLGRFEKGAQKINIELLDDLIARLGINTTDFIMRLHTEFPSYADEMAEEVYNYIVTGEKTDKIWKKTEELYENYKETGLYLANYYQIFIKISYCNRHRIPYKSLLNADDYKKIDYLKDWILNLDEFYTFDYAVLDILMDPIPEQFTTDFLIHSFNTTLKQLSTISNASPMIHNAFSFLTTATGVLSSRGEYAIAQECVEKTYQLLLDTPMIAVLNPYFQIIMSFQETYNLLRQNKAEGMEKAHHIIRTLDNMISINPLPRIVNHKENFIREVLDLNQTGIELDLTGGQ